MTWKGIWKQVILRKQKILSRSFSLQRKGLNTVIELLQIFRSLFPNIHRMLGSASLRGRNNVRLHTQFSYFLQGFITLVLSLAPNLKTSVHGQQCKGPESARERRSLGGPHICTYSKVQSSGNIYCKTLHKGMAEKTALILIKIYYKLYGPHLVSETRIKTSKEKNQVRSGITTTSNSSTW